MGCGASADKAGEREDIYKEIQVDDRPVANEDIQAVLKSPDSSKSWNDTNQITTSGKGKDMFESKHTTSRLCSRLRKGIKYCEILQDAEDRHPAKLMELFELIHGKRSIVTLPPVLPGPHEQVTIITDFGVVGMSVDKGQTQSIENATQTDMLNILTSMSRNARSRRITSRFVKGHAKPVKVVSLASNDWLLVTTDTALGPSEARVLDVTRDEQCGTLDGRRRDCFDSAYDASFTIDGTALASVHRMEKLFLWDMNTFRVKRTASFTEDNGEIRMSLVKFSPDAKRIAVGAEAAYEDAETVGILLLYDSQCKLVARHACEEHCITSLGFSNDSNFVICGFQNGMVSVINTRSVETVHNIQAHVSSVRGLHYAPCGQRLMSADEKEVAMWDTKTWEKVWSRTTENSPSQARPAPAPLRAPAPLHSPASKHTEDSTPGPSPSSSSPRSRANILPPVMSAIPSPTSAPPAPILTQPPVRILRNTCAICAPGSLVMVARSDKSVVFLEQDTGEEHSQLPTKGVVMRMDAGCKSVAMGDVYGNVYMVDVL